MKYAICILAHTKPALLSRLTDYLKRENVEIFIHIDAKSNISEFDHIQGVTFIKKRVKVYWGHYSMIKAMYNLIEYVVDNTDCGYIMFISGEDFPIVSPDKYNSYIDASKNYIEYEKLPKKNWYEGGINRVKYFYLFNKPRSVLCKILIKLQKIIGIARNYNKKFSIFGGSQMININRETAEYIMREWKHYYPYFRLCNIPDEMIFQTIIMNSPLKDTVINTHNRYLVFNSVEKHPKYLDEENINEIINSKALFCRKIKNEEVFDRLIKRIIAEA